MRKIYISLVVLILIIFSCEKPTEFPLEQDVVFKGAPTAGLKASCDQPIAQYALIEIDGTTHQVGVFYLNGRIYTNSLKLESGEHTLSQFILVNDANTPVDPEDDIIVMAAPEAGSLYANFVSKPLPFDFQVDAFFKTEVLIELMCFEPNDFENFGFNWFTVEVIEPFSGYETAYAYDPEGETCFIDIPEIKTDNWGWSNGTYTEGEYTLQLWAAAGQCDLSNGYNVGNVVLKYNTDGHVTVTYNLNAGYQFNDIHLYVGCSIYQIGNETVAPSQFPYKADGIGTSYEFDLKMDTFSDPIYIIAHSEVCKI